MYGIEFNPVKNLVSTDKCTIVSCLRPLHFRIATTLLAIVAGKYAFFQKRNCQATAMAINSNLLWTYGHRMEHFISTFDVNPTIQHKLGQSIKCVGYFTQISNGFGPPFGEHWNTINIFVFTMCRHRHHRRRQFHCTVLVIFTQLLELLQAAEFLLAKTYFRCFPVAAHHLCVYAKCTLKIQRKFKKKKKNQCIYNGEFCNCQQ